MSTPGGAGTPGTHIPPCSAHRLLSWGRSSLVNLAPALRSARPDTLSPRARALADCRNSLFCGRAHSFVHAQKIPFRATLTTNEDKVFRGGAVRYSLEYVELEFSEVRGCYAFNSRSCL